MTAISVGVGYDTPSLDQSLPSDSLGTMIVGHLPSIPNFSEEALKEARELKTPDMGGGSSVGDPFRDCFAGVDDASDISDASFLLEEAQHFISRAISRFRVDLSQCEVELQKVSGERDALRLLCSQKDEVINDLQADLAKAHEEEAELDKQGKWPSPLFPIEVKNIKFAKHGSDSDVYDTEGRFVPEKFEELFKKHARTNGNALTASELDELLKANKQPKDFAGHIAAKSEWKVLYLLCKDEHGLLPKDTVRSVYDGSLFELMAKAKQSKKHERG
ncbi:uncharacterized protein LOC107791606 isoform X1 [Nicotiana tabacum]|uniref:Uncharacterized protein LOC107791606 isoform X1 n=1 Tax=Nicotiana tabacum TaxID=4097 RepID=A0AC58RYW7_TOBAC